MVAYMRGEGKERCNSAPSRNSERGEKGLRYSECCKGCTLRYVGCRSNCEAWTLHEQEKAEDYARRNTEFQGFYVSKSMRKILSDKARCVHGFRHHR